MYIANPELCLLEVIYRNRNWLIFAVVYLITTKLINMKCKMPKCKKPNSVLAKAMANPPNALHYFCPQLI